MFICPCWTGSSYLVVLTEPHYSLTKEAIRLWRLATCTQT